MTSNPQNLCPFTETSSVSVMVNHYVGRCVSVLLRAGGPSAILRVVAYCSINAINRVVCGRPLPHIFKEQPEVLPSFTDSNFMRDVKFMDSATIPHGTPRLVCQCVTLPVLCGLFPVVSTSAGLASLRSSFQGIGPSDIFEPTATPNIPKADVIRILAGVSNYVQLPETLTSQIRNR